MTRVAWESAGTPRRTVLIPVHKIKNAAQDLAGKAKEAVGHATNDEGKVAEGKKDQAAASVKKTGEDVKDAFRD